MRFESGELKPYAEYVLTDSLEEGTIYFYVTFVDDGMLVPILEPLVFIGLDLECGDVGKVYFQDASSFLDGIRYSGNRSEIEETKPHRDALIYSFPADAGHVLEYERALDILLSCALKRREIAGG